MVTPYQAPDYTRSILNGIQTAVSIEQLGKLQQQRSQDKAMKEAASSSYVTEQTPMEDGQVNTQVNFDPKLYAKKLESIDPAKAQEYRKSVDEHDMFKQKLEEGELSIKDKKLDLEVKEKAQGLKMKMLEHDAISKAYDYGKATNFSDQTGIQSIVNPYLPPNEQITAIKPMDAKGKNVLVTHKDGTTTTINNENMQFLGASQDTQLKEYVALTNHREYLDMARERDNDKYKNKAAKKPGQGEFNAAMSYIQNTKDFSDVPKDQHKAASFDLANEINGIQQKAVNNKEEPPTAEEARDQAAGTISARVGQVAGKLYGTNSKYFSSPSEVEAALQNKQISEAEYKRIIKNGFPDYLEKLKAKK